MSSVPATPSQEGPAFWDYHAKLLPGVSEVRGEEVKGWDVDRVSAFVGSLPGCEDHAKYFREQVSEWLDVCVCVCVCVCAKGSWRGRFGGGGWVNDYVCVCVC